MEEAEELCDRIGIFINGNFHCIGTPKEVKKNARTHPM
jgi:ABC-type multidrug transport system ATPase subunit